MELSAILLADTTQQFRSGIFRGQSRVSSVGDIIIRCDSIAIGVWGFAGGTTIHRRVPFRRGWQFLQRPAISSLRHGATPSIATTPTIAAAAVAPMSAAHGPLRRRRSPHRKHSPRNFGGDGVRGATRSPAEVSLIRNAACEQVFVVSPSHVVSLDRSLLRVHCL